jgi:hypothetical protein
MNLGMRLVVVATATLAAGLSSRADGPADGDKLAPLARFAGEWEVNGTWSDGKKLHARNVYAWSLGKKILTSRTFVRDGDKEYQRYEGILAWHPQKKCLYQINFAYDGNITETVVESKNADTLHLGWEPFTPGKPSPARSVIRFLDNDRFQWTVSVRDGDGWKQIIDATWTRKK